MVRAARAIIGNLKLLLADEPTGNLHSEQMASYGNRIIRLKDGVLVNELDTSLEGD